MLQTRCGFVMHINIAYSFFTDLLTIFFKWKTDEYCLFQVQRICIQKKTCIIHQPFSQTPTKVLVAQFDVLSWALSCNAQILFSCGLEKFQYVTLKYNTVLWLWSAKYTDNTWISFTFSSTLTTRQQTTQQTGKSSRSSRSCISGTTEVPWTTTVYHRLTLIFRSIDTRTWYGTSYSLLSAHKD